MATKAKRKLDYNLFQGEETIVNRVGDILKENSVPNWNIQINQNNNIENDANPLSICITVFRIQAFTWRNIKADVSFLLISKPMAIVSHWASSATVEWPRMLFTGPSPRSTPFIPAKQFVTQSPHSLFATSRALLFLCLMRILLWERIMCSI
jgi:hypothetical protein